MLVKCRACEKKIDRASAFKIRIRDTNQYYCSEDEYKEKLKRANSVKCSFCGRQISKDTAFIERINGQNQYYCSEDEYHDKCFYKDERKKLDGLLKDLIGEPVPYGTINQKIGSYLKNEMVSTLRNFISDNKENIAKSMSLKEFRTLSGKAAYFCAIVGNGIRNYRIPQEPIITKSASEDDYVHEENPVIQVVRPKQKNKRIGFAELEDI